MKLEDFRNQQLVGESVFMSDYFNGAHLPFLFHQTSNDAFYMTIDALNRMQNQDSIGTNTYCMPGVGLWFQATESYLSTIYKLAVAESARTQRSIKKTMKVMQKFDAINRYFSIPTPLSLKSQLQDFVNFRNGIFHDLTLTHSNHYSHTLFSLKPEKLNEIDLFQSLLVSVSLFAHYRYLFMDTDLMPQIGINAQFEDLDKLVEEILIPAFKDILEAKGMGTSLDLSLPSSHCSPHSYPIAIKAIISYDGPQYTNRVSKTSPSTTHKYYLRASDSRPMDPTKFRLPNYTRNKLARASNASSQIPTYEAHPSTPIAPDLPPHT